MYAPSDDGRAADARVSLIGYWDTKSKIVWGDSIVDEESWREKE